MPLSKYGLWEAEITAPIAPARAASKATAGVGVTPNRRTSTPSAARPATNAASSIAVDTRLSPPTTASRASSTLCGGTAEVERERRCQLGVRPTPDTIRAEPHERTCCPKR